MNPDAVAIGHPHQTDLPNAVRTELPLQRGYSDAVAVGHPHRTDLSNAVRTELPLRRGNSDGVAIGHPHRNNLPDAVQTELPLRRGNSDGVAGGLPHRNGVFKRVEQALPHRNDGGNALLSCLPHGRAVFCVVPSGRPRWVQFVNQDLPANPSSQHPQEQTKRKVSPVMASNEIPKSYDPLVQLLEDAADGAHQHEAAVKLKQNTEASIRADLEALVGQPAGPGGTPPAVPGFKSLWNAAKANKTSKTAALRTAASNGRTLAMTCTGTLKPVLGQQWNSTWNAAGFTDGSLAVPDNPMTMLQQLRAYYAANPAREVANVQGIACTAAACEAAAQAIGTAQSASNQSNTDAGQAQSDLQGGLAAGRKRLSGLREELARLIKDDDERWYAFGFDKPGDSSAPEVPENLVATPGAPGSRLLMFDWDDARRADGYRVRVTNAAGGATLAEILTQDSEVVIPNLPAGATVNLIVTARNATGESQPTPPITAVAP